MTQVINSHHVSAGSAADDAATCAESVPVAMLRGLAKAGAALSVLWDALELEEVGS